MNKIKGLTTKASAMVVSSLMFVNGSTFASGAAGQAKTGVDNMANAVGATDDANTMVQKIITAIIGVIGIVAVIMIILGGISYTTSQGDPSKTKKAKDTILYGVIGLIVALMAFAIVSFVLGSL